MKVRYMLGSLMVAVVLTSSCGGGGSSPTSPAASTPSTPGTPAAPAAPAANEIIATTASTFNPAALTVTKGTTVTFTFQSVAHDVVFDATTGAPSGIAATSSNAVQRVFANAGTYGFQCTLHGGMRGSVTVN